MAEYAEYISAHNKIVESYAAKMPFKNDAQSENETRKMCHDMVAAIINFGVTKPAALRPALGVVQKMMHCFARSLIKEQTFDFDVFQKEIVNVISAANVSELNDQDVAATLFSTIIRAHYNDIADATEYLPDYIPTPENDYHVNLIIELFVKAYKYMRVIRECHLSATASTHEPTITNVDAAVKYSEKYVEELMNEVVNMTCYHLYGSLYFAACLAP